MRLCAGVEIMFDPQPHRRVACRSEAFFATGMDEARRIGARDYGVESNFILSINRDPLSTRHWRITRSISRRRFTIGIVGFGLDSVEEGQSAGEVHRSL